MTLLRVAAVGSKELNAAGNLVRRYPDQDLTLADAAGLHLMSVRRIRECWSTDRHLGLTGVPLAIHQH